jgi:hypothetical protein
MNQFWYQSADLGPYQNVMDPEYCYYIIIIKYSNVGVFSVFSRLNFVT